MLLEFSVANFRSINKKCTLSMKAQGISDEPRDNITNINRLKVLKSAVIYGANSSGKTNIVRAIFQMCNNLTSSVKLNDGDALAYEPFLLTTNSHAPSFFEIIFIEDDSKYRYGFELTSKSIHGEWLFKSKLNSKQEKPLFIRTEQGIGVDGDNFDEGVGKEGNTNDNRLFLSLCAQLGGTESKKIVGWFQKNVHVISGLEASGYQGFSKIMFHKNLDGSDKAKEFFQNLQLGFRGLETKEMEIGLDNLPEDMPDELKEKLLKSIKGGRSIQLESQHNIYDEKGNPVNVKNFDVDGMESEGTKKLIQLSCPIFDTLEKGEILVIDELDAKMHPLISLYIIKLFNNAKTNPNNAQLIFTTHDTNLLNSSLFRRDQIWFTEKDHTEQTDLYNMMDIVLPNGDKPRNDANYERNYIAGRYGAIPYILNE